MRTSQENLLELQRKINELLAENIVMKKQNEELQKIIKDNNIPYEPAIPSTDNFIEKEEYDPNQAGRILHPIISDEAVKAFYTFFKARYDVYSVRHINKEGKTSYIPQCANNCNDRYDTETGTYKCSTCNHKNYESLSTRYIYNHLTGNPIKDGKKDDAMGVYPLFENNTCNFLVFDFDCHRPKKMELPDFANPKGTPWIDEVNELVLVLKMNEVPYLLERSRSGNGCHIWIFFDTPIKARIARRFAMALLDRGAEQMGIAQFVYYDRIIPLQDSLPAGHIGNTIALPLNAIALKKGNTAFIDSNWNAYPNQWDALFSTQKISPSYIEEKIKEWMPEYSDDYEGKKIKPDEVKNKFSHEEVEGKMKIFVSNGIYIDLCNISMSLLSKLKTFASVKNKQRYIKINSGNYYGGEPYAFGYWREDKDTGYIEIPRGLYDPLIEKLEEAQIEYTITDERVCGKEIDVKFTGEYRTHQPEALMALSQYENGLLEAPPAFGKTAIACALIGIHKVNTLIVCRNSGLLEQWKSSIEQFLDINEVLPTYVTPKGRTKTSKSCVNILKGAQKRGTEIIDIAMPGALFEKNEPTDLLNKYGMIIVDEAHHIAAESFLKIFKHAKAKYIYGLTATPNREDGKGDVLTMYLGPMRYIRTSKEQIEENGIESLVYPRFTRCVTPRGKDEKMTFGQASTLVSKDTERNRLIIEDTINCIRQGRNPIVLSKRVEHVNLLGDELSKLCPNVFVLTGKNKKEHKQINEKIKNTPSTDPMIIVATGDLVGEGFDVPRLDTLVLALPISGETNVKQYTGRIERIYPGKTKVIVYDYIDHHIPILNNSYVKRLRSYKITGFKISSDPTGNIQESNAIFDADNFESTFYEDVNNANKRIIISSPVIAGDKVNKFIRAILPAQLKGVEVIVITWQPDLYNFGDSSYWMQLHNEMRNAGIEMKLAEEFCERFCIIDDELVWYGNINLLGNTKEENSIMRMKNAKAASELIEMTFATCSDKISDISNYWKQND